MLQPKYNSSERLFGLDVIRCLAIILVMMDHSLKLLPSFAGKETLENFTGVVGVELFFTLSGFLIGTILLKILAGSQPFTPQALLQFWKKRWFRTLPAFWILLLLYTCLYLVFRFNEFGSISFKKFLLLPFFLQNVVTPHPNFFPIAWSLSIEEWFYLTFPVLILVVSSFAPTRWNRQKIYLGCALTMVGLAFLIRTGLYMLYTNGMLANIPVADLGNKLVKGSRKTVVLRIDATAYGVLMAYFIYAKSGFIQRFRKLLIAAGLGLFLLAACFLFSFFDSNSINAASIIFMFPLFNISFALILLFFHRLKTPVTYKATARWIQNISIVSYSIYLTHTILWSFLAHYVHTGNMGIQLLAAMLLLIGSYIVSVYSYEYIEKTGMHLRTQKITFFKRKEPEAGTIAATNLP